MYTLIAFSNRLNRFAPCDESADLTWLTAKMQLCACAYIEDESGVEVASNRSLELVTA